MQQERLPGELLPQIVDRPAHVADHPPQRPDVAAQLLEDLLELPAQIFVSGRGLGQRGGDRVDPVQDPGDLLLQLLTACVTRVE